MALSSGSNGIVIYSRFTIKIGAATIPNLDAVQSGHDVAYNAIGLLPASIFH
jgi:hypothetical protein